MFSRISPRRARIPELDVLIVGPYPPPLGGVASHVSRLVEVLTEQGLSVGEFNHFGHRDGDAVVGALHRNPLRYWLQLRRVSAPVVHYHHSRLSTLVAVAVARRRTGTYVATIHGHTLARQLDLPLIGTLARWALKRFDELVAVSVEISTVLDERVGHQRVTVLPAYLPIGPTDRKQPGALDEFMRSRRTLVASAYQIAAAPGNHGDVYGLDRAVEAFLRLLPTNPELRLAILVAKPIRGRWARRYVSGLMARIAEHGATEKVELRVGEALSPLFLHDIVYLRPTRSDGDAVSIREAIAAGRPVIASNAVRRPSGVQTIRGDDFEAWSAAIEAALESSQDQASRARDIDLAASPTKAIVDFYASRLSSGTAIAA